MDLSTMVSPFMSNGKVEMTISQAGDLYDIARRVRDGDESGWRGDPDMFIQFDPRTLKFEVIGRDAHGQPYVAASHEKLDHTLLIKLRDGDPRRTDVWQNVLDHNTKLKADQKAKDDEKFYEIGEKIKHAVQAEFHGRRNPITVDRKMEK